MARAKAVKVKENEADSPFKRELLSLFFLAAGIFLGISLFSYDPQDPSFLTLSLHRGVSNWGGLAGAYLSDSLLFLFGGASFIIPVFFTLLSVLFLFGARQKVEIHELPTFIVFIVFIAILLQLTKGTLRFDDTRLPAGGFFGDALAHLCQAYLGYMGAYLVVIVGATLTFIASTQLSLKSLLTHFYNYSKKSCAWVYQKCLIAYGRIEKSYNRWRDERIVANKNDAIEEIETDEEFADEKSIRIQRHQLKATENVDVSEEEIVDDKYAADEEEVSESGEKPLPSVAMLRAQAKKNTEGPMIRDRVDKKKPVVQSTQLELAQISGAYQLPPLSMLDMDIKQEVTIDEESLKMNARLLEKKLLDFSVEGRVTEIHPGPVITMYEFEPAPGVKLSRIANLVDDLSLAMGGRNVRIVAPLPNKAAVGIEIPNNERETVILKDIIADERFQKADSKLVVALGKDVEGIPYVADLAKMPHLMVAGATGSGKSVSINDIILSILYKSTPEEVRILMVDPKMLELSIYQGIPHLLLPVVTEPKKASLALKWAVREMERRYKLLSDINARNIINYNKKIEKGEIPPPKTPEELALMGDAEPVVHNGKIPYIVIIIDELADLMMVSARDVEESITRLAQMARAAGIHLILATQRPSVDVITGVIKANFPARISFKVSSKHDSRTILDAIGAERLLGAGDMLYIPPGASKMMRVHGAFVTETEVTKVVDFLKKQAKPVYDESILKTQEAEAAAEGGIPGVEPQEVDALYDQAVSIVAETRQASISMVQRKLRVGYNRAARMIERMEQEGIVSTPTGTGHRQVLVSSLSGEIG